MDKLTAHTSGAPRPQKQGARPHRGGQFRVGVGGSTGPPAQNGMTGLIILLNHRTLSSDTGSILPKTHQWSVKINFSFSTVNIVIPEPKATPPVKQHREAPLRALLVAQRVKHPPASAGDMVQSLVQEDPTRLKTAEPTLSLRSRAGSHKYGAHDRALEAGAP